MKRIIDGLTYNTETATKVASWSHGYRGDHGMYEESIYVTKHGRWFRSGFGGPASMYAKSVDNNSYSGGSGLFPLTEDEAMQILESYHQTDALEEHFSHRLEEA